MKQNVDTLKLFHAFNCSAPTAWISGLVLPMVLVSNVVTHNTFQELLLIFFWFSSLHAGNSVDSFLSMQWIIEHTFCLGEISDISFLRFWGLKIDFNNHFVDFKRRRLDPWKKTATRNRWHWTVGVWPCWCIGHGDKQRKFEFLVSVRCSKKKMLRCSGPGQVLGS